MGKLKPYWTKTDIPKSIKVKLWLAMKDNPTLESWQQAIAKMDFEKSDDKYIKTSYDTYRNLKDEIKSMPKEEIDTLHHELRVWVYSIRSGETVEHTLPSPVEQQKEHVRKLQEMARTAFDSLPLHFPDLKTAPPEVFDDFNEAVVKVYRRLTEDPDWNELAHHLGDEAKKIESLSNELDDFLPGGSAPFPKLDRYYETLQEAWLTIKAGGIKTISEYSDRRRWDYYGLMPTCPKCPDQNWPTSYSGVQN